MIIDNTYIFYFEFPKVAVTLLLKAHYIYNIIKYFRNNKIITDYQEQSTLIEEDDPMKWIFVR